MDKQEIKEAIKDYFKDLPSTYIVPVSSNKNNTGFIIDHEIKIDNEEYLELIKEMAKE